MKYSQFSTISKFGLGSAYLQNSLSTSAHLVGKRTAVGIAGTNLGRYFIVESCYGRSPERESRIIVWFLAESCRRGLRTLYSCVAVDSKCFGQLHISLSVFSMFSHMCLSCIKPCCY
jgi:hypothetical protein